MTSAQHEQKHKTSIKFSFQVMLLGYSVVKMGIRRCRIDYILTGKSLILPLIYSMNHPIYRKIICYMDMDWVAMPDIVV